MIDDQSKIINNENRHRSTTVIASTCFTQVQIIMLIYCASRNNATGTSYWHCRFDCIRDSVQVSRIQEYVGYASSRLIQLSIPKNVI